MTPKDWFGLGLRFAGVWCALQSAAQLMGFLDVRLRLGSDRVMTAYGEQIVNPQAYLLYAVGYAMLALLLVLRTDYLVRVSYQSPEPSALSEVGP